MTQSKIVVTAWVEEEVRDILAPHGVVLINENREHCWSESDRRIICADADAMMTFMTDRIDDAFLDACPNLKVIACALKGFDNFDIDACTRRGVWVTIVPDLLTAPTAELAVTLVLGLGRHILAGDRRMRSGGFDGWRPVLYGAGLAGRTVGIAGFGAVGQAIARRLSGFDCRVLAWDSNSKLCAGAKAIGVEMTHFDQMLAVSDVVISALPLAPGLRHLFDAGAILGMKPRALLVNVGRGSVVDEAAVADALACDHLGGYAADVFEMEDLALHDRPRGVLPRLLEMMDRTLLTPHLGSAVETVRRDIALAAARNVVAGLSGKRPPDAVNDPVWSAAPAPGFFIEKAPSFRQGG